MPIPPAEPGLVISYAFLWSHEHDRGDVEGRKRRPCAVVLAIRTEAGRVTATVAPITHSPPRDAAAAVEIPPGSRIIWASTPRVRGSSSTS